MTTDITSPAAEAAETALCLGEDWWFSRRFRAAGSWFWGGMSI